MTRRSWLFVAANVVAQFALLLLVASVTRDNPGAQAVIAVSAVAIAVALYVFVRRRRRI
jgi:hypothetical protein